MGNDTFRCPALAACMGNKEPWEPNRKDARGETEV
jgi:hypothetical protein